MAGYGTDDLFAAWMVESGHEMPTGAPAPAILRQRASDYIDGLYGARFKGVLAGGFEQERSWPRTGAVVHRQAIPDDVIPDAVIRASYAAALYEAQNPGGLEVAVSASGAVKRERIEGAVDTEYFEGSGDAAADATIRLSAVEGLLSPFLQVEATGGAFWMRAVG